MNPASDIAFTPAVKKIQQLKGSRSAYEKVEKNHGWETTATPQLEQFLSELDMFYFGTATTDGQPYIQYRGGPKGLLKKLDDKHLAFADFGGNRQYISVGNLSENPKAFIFLMDYENRRRIKIWGTARVVEDDQNLLAELSDPEYRAKVERAIVLEIEAWDVNCPQHIHRRINEADVERMKDALQTKIDDLEAEVSRLKDQLNLVQTAKSDS